MQIIDINATSSQAANTQRDDHIRLLQEGRMAWQKQNNYGLRSHVEQAFLRYKIIIGQDMKARELPQQKTEGGIGARVLNRMTSLEWLEVELPDYFEDRILNIDIKVADMWGQLQGKNKGHTLPAIDGLIAATAKFYDLTLVTRNVKDFINASIEIINPWERNHNL